ncbi:MAG: DNA polymerase III subunit delta [Alistipes sp.]|nr:DNA polymerase III subunit delta [Alistipes sp.]
MAKSSKFNDALTSYNSIMKDIEARRFAPIYLLSGDEGYFIDAIAERLGDTILNEAERSFNQVTVYGADSDTGKIVMLCRQMPMMGNYQVVIVREAQQLTKMENLVHYTSSPQSTTILIICYKNKEQGKGLDKRTAFYKSCAKAGCVFESVRPKEYEIDQWLNSHINSRGFSIEPKAIAMLKEHVGMDISRIVREIDKLAVSINEGQTKITDADIEQYIGISKEFNSFELNDAVMKRDVGRAMRIAEHFAHNPKNYPITQTIILLFNQFQQLFLLNYHMWQSRKRGIPMPPDTELMSAVRANHPFVLKELKANIGRWTGPQLFRALGLLREYDAKSKGVNSGGLDSGELLKELLLKIFM